METGRAAEFSFCSTPCQSVISVILQLPGFRLRNKKPSDVNPLQPQQPYFFLNAPCITGEAAVRPDNTVAGNNHGNPVMPHRPADRLRGLAAGLPRSARRFAIAPYVVVSPYGICRRISQTAR